jgi:TatA/E family protein of Tat protein translocase
MPNISPIHLVIVLIIALIVIGPGKLPEVGAALGKSIKEFRKAASDITDSTHVDAAPASVAPAAAVAPAAVVTAVPTPMAAAAAPLAPDPPVSVAPEVVSVAPAPIVAAPTPYPNMVAQPSANESPSPESAS